MWLNRLWSDTAEAVWIRALLYLILVAGGWLIVLPGSLLFVEQGRLAVQFQEMPLWLTGGVTFFVGAVLGFVAGFYLIADFRRGEID